MMTFGSLFAGIGGFDLGLERSGMECRWQVEINNFCQKVLNKHWPDVPKYRDIRAVGGHNLEAVDLICGGFPCQPFSSASRGRITAEDFWPEMFRVIKETKPRIIIAENVKEKPIRRSQEQLKATGYTAGVYYFNACKFGAWHRRDRWIAVAHTDDKGEFQSRFDAEMALLQSMENNFWEWPDITGTIRVSNGIPNRMDRLRSLGNAVVPQIIESIGNIINKIAN